MNDPEPEDPRTAIAGLFAHSSTRSAVGYGGAFVWLALIVFPLLNAIARHGPFLRHLLPIAGSAVFVAAYAGLIVSWRRHQRMSRAAALFALLIGVATALTLADQSGWGFLFTYCAACAALV